MASASGGASMGSGESKRINVRRQCLEQVHLLATSMENNLHEMRESIWGWPSTKRKSGPMEATFAAPMSADHAQDGNWSRIRTARGDEVLFEVVVADLDGEFISACHRHFAPQFLNRKGGGVTLMHEPMQQAIAESLGQSDVHTFVVFGTYPEFPGPKSKGYSCMTGLAKSFILPVFPSSWRSFARQCPSDFGSAGDTGMMEPRSRSWMAEPEIPHVLTLVACEAYPRDQHPTEAAATTRHFLSSLFLIGSAVGLLAPRRKGRGGKSAPPRTPTHNSAGMFSDSAVAVADPAAVTSTSAAAHCVNGSSTQKSSDYVMSATSSAKTQTRAHDSPHSCKKGGKVSRPSCRKIRVITHAIGSFVGHTEVGLTP